MKVNHSKFIHFTLICMLSLFIPQYTFAQETQKISSTEKIKIDDEYYTRGQIIADFLNAAFASRMWNEDLNSRQMDGYSKSIDWYKTHAWDVSDKKVQEGYNNQKIWNPWFVDYMYRPNGWPRHNVLNKWKDELSVGVGWPPYTLSNRTRQHKGSPYNPEKIEILSQTIKLHVESIAPELERETGLPIKVLGLADAQDYTDAYAKIRIIPMENLGSRAWVDLMGHNWMPSAYESWLMGGVLFESSDFSHMDAFILPNEKNEIGLVICKIKSDLPDDMFKSLITECLVRATGLPSFSKLKKDTFLGNWRNDLENKGTLKHAASSLNPYDKYIINMLYCPSLKPAMDKNEVLNTLTKNDDCFNIN